MPLSDNKIKQAKPSEKEYRLYDMDGLYLAVRPSGMKIWRYKFRILKKEYTYTIGRYPDISLKAAREELKQARKLVVQGINPTYEKSKRIIEKSAESEFTFRHAAEEYMATKSKRSQAYIQGIERDFKKYVYPTIGKLPLNAITPAHIKYCLDKCKAKGIIVTGINIRNRINAVFMLAIRTMKTQNNPALAFSEYFERPDIQHAEALTTLELKAFKASLEAYNGTFVVKSIVKLLLYTAVRTIEARRAEWKDIDLDNAVWHIPAGKMKKSRPHTISLSRQVVEMLAKLKQFTGGAGRVFPNSKRPADMVSATTVNRALQYMGVTFTGHDFRATMATHLSEMGYDKEYIKTQLSHAKGDQTDAAYFHAKFIKQRREMMQDWADFIDGL